MGKIPEGGPPVALCINCRVAFYVLKVSRGRSLIHRVRLHHRKFHGRVEKVAVLA